MFVFEWAFSCDIMSLACIHNTLGGQREFIFIEYIKKGTQMDYLDNGLKAQGSLSQDKISADKLAPIV